MVRSNPDDRLQASGTVAGVDEAGRGCLAGPVHAAAVILPPDHGLDGLDDSKRLSPARRTALAPEIRSCSIAFAIGVASVEEIAQLNILHATMLAMARAVAQLGVRPDRVRVDGNRSPALSCPVECLPGGDGIDPAIMAASILAKVTRDEAMVALDGCHPGYGFARHKGYGTREHLAALERLGPAPCHRRTFAPVAQMRLRLEAIA